MSEAPLPLPEACRRTLEAVLVDPLEPGPEAEAHLRTCRACAEVRVSYLALEEVPETLAPAGYFDRLPGRVLRKLPARSGLQHRMHPVAWAAAAALLMAVGTGAFWVGRANRTPLVEATLPRPTEVLESTVTVSDTLFHDREEDAAQIQALSAEEMKALLKRLDTPPPPSR